MSSTATTENPREAAGRQAVIASSDISEEAHCRSLVERQCASSELGKLDILINNAAYQMTREGIE